MKTDKEVRQTRRLVKQAIFLHGMRTYDLDDEYLLPILDESLGKYVSEKNKMMQHKIISNIKTEMDLDTILSMLPYIRLRTDEELNKIGNIIFATLKSLTLKKKDKIEEFKDKNNQDELNKIAKKNNAYIYLCETISAVVVDRIQVKHDFTILNGFSTGMLKFVLKDVVYRKVKNARQYFLDLEFEPKDETALKEDFKYQQIINEIENIFSNRKYDVSGKLQDYIQQIKDEEASKFED